MPKIYYSCDEIPRNWHRYFGLCNAVELDLENLEHPPKKETLSRWRVESPKGFAFHLHADPAVIRGLADAARRQETPDKLPESLYEGWQTTLANAQALAAKTIVLSTPDSFTPNQRSRAALELFCSQCVQEAPLPVIWESRGSWDTEHTREWAAERGLTYLYDPFLALRDEIGFLHGDGAFLLTERGGVRREFDRYELRRLVDKLSSYDRAFFFLRGRFKWSHAESFRELDL